MTESWWPQEYCHRYPERCASPYDGPPHYPIAPTFVIHDYAERRYSETPRRLKFWLKARTLAIMQWERAGFFMPVKMMDPQPLYSPGAISIDVRKTADGTGGQADFGALPDDDETPMAGIAWAHVNRHEFYKAFFARNVGPLAKILAHEIGHTLAFGHNPGTSGYGPGIMSSPIAEWITDEEVDIARTFWRGKMNRGPR